MTNKFVMSKPSMSALLLVTGILFTVSCSKPGTAATDPYQSSARTVKQTSTPSISSTGVFQVVTVAGSGITGYFDAAIAGAAYQARFNLPSGAVVDSSGNIYVCLLYTSPSPRDS